MIGEQGRSEQGMILFRQNCEAKQAMARCINQETCLVRLLNQNFSIIQEKLSHRVIQWFNSCATP